MGQFKCKMTGMHALLAKTDSLAKNFHTDIMKEMDEVANSAKTDIASTINSKKGFMTPTPWYETGALLGTLTTWNSEDRVGAGFPEGVEHYSGHTTAELATILEHGTAKIPPQPVLFVTYMNNEEKYQRKILKLLKRVVK